MSVNSGYESESDTISTVSMAHSGSVLAREEGNTTPPPSLIKKRISASKYWVFTYNNYSEAHVAQLARLLGEKGSYVFGKEVGQNGTPHLQGWCEFTKKARPSEYLCRSATGDWGKKIHWEKARGSKGQCIEYCVKEGGQIFSNINYKMYIPYVVKDRMAGKEFKDWQLEIIEEIKHDPSDRKIFWYVDEKGGAGKTTFCHWLSMYYGAMCFSGSAKDCMYGLSKCKEDGLNVQICIFDFPRCLEDKFLSYMAIEQVKNGYFYSTKYECAMYTDNPKHIFIFSNHEPERHKMSEDRWVVKNIN